MTEKIRDCKKGGSKEIASYFSCKVEKSRLIIYLKY